MAPPMLNSTDIKKLKPMLLHTFQFTSFVGLSGDHFFGDFEHNIASFLQQIGEIQNYEVVTNSTAHLITVRGPEELLFPLHIIHETVEGPPLPPCHECKTCGWGDHFASKSKYHFIVPERDRWNMHLDCDSLVNRKHILYGLIHSNGHGHLICINGVKVDSYSLVEKISEFPCEDEAMDFWDCICSLLHPRAITVFDDMDVKFLHVLAFGKSWYGKWGYQFCKGYFGVTKIKYEKAVRVLSTLGIQKIETDAKSMGGLNTRIEQIIEKNRQSLNNTSNFLQFMLAFEANVSMNVDSVSSSLAKGGKRSTGNIKYVLASVTGIMKQKKAAKFDKLTKQQLVKEMRSYLTDRRLTDFVLDNVSLFTMEDHVIRCSVNSSTKVQELTIHEISQQVKLKMFPFYGFFQGVKLVGRIDLGESLDKDVLDFYEAVRSVYIGEDSVSLAIEVVLNSSYFVKEWPLEEPDSPISATKLCKRFLKTILEHYDAEEIGEVEQGGDDNLLPCTCGMHLAKRLSYEDELHKFNVYCTCGTMYDDGKRMAKCSVCHVIHHTKCSGIEDNADVPAEFLCARCKNQ